MAKSARASKRKENKSKLRATVFGPTENLRVERLSSKLLALAAEAKPERSPINNSKAGLTNDTKDSNLEIKNQAEEMDVDTELPKTLAQYKSSRRHKVAKRSIYCKNAISFPKYNKKKL